MSAVDIDWRENKEYILKTLPRLEQRIDALEVLLRTGFKDMQKEVSDLRAALAPDIERLISEVWQEARKSDSEEIPRQKLDQLVNGQKTKEKSWQPWQYVLLGAIIAVAGDRIMELALKVL